MLSGSTTDWRWWMVGIAAIHRRVTRWGCMHTSFLYGPGDMRRAYRWTRDALVALLLVAGLILVWRLAVTTVFITHVSPDPSAIVFFNMALSGTVAGILVGRSTIRRRVRRWVKARQTRPPRPPGPL